MIFGCLHLNQKTKENSVSLPYLSKIGQIKKRMQIIILKDKWSLISKMMSQCFYDLTHSRGRAEILKYFRSFFGSNKDIQKTFWKYLTFRLGSFFSCSIRFEWWVKMTMSALGQHWSLTSEWMWENKKTWNPNLT